MAGGRFIQRDIHPRNRERSSWRQDGFNMLALMEKYRKILGFITFGGLAGMVYAVILVASVDAFGLPIFLGSVIAFALAIPVSYFGNRWVTYRSNNMLASEVYRFLVVQTLNLVLTSVVVHFMIEWFGLPTYTGVIVAFIAAPVISFVLFELWVYRQRQGTDVFREAPARSNVDQ